MDIFLIVITLAHVFGKVISDCDTLHAIIEEEDGRIGLMEFMPWLGLLNVYLYADSKMETAITGVVLIHKEYAIIHADDVARLPDKVFRENTSVMFYRRPQEPWYCRPLSYIIHPEYKENTFNTVAILELNLVNLDDHDLKPICWMPELLNNALNYSYYAAGYSDDHYQLEKEIRKVAIYDKKNCTDLYQSEGLNDMRREPVNYQCYSSPTMRYPCVWENGMILVQVTAQKFYNLVGFGVQGPGCKSPARFIELKPYYNWFSENIFVKNKANIKISHGGKDIPLHDLKSSMALSRRNLGYDYFYNLNIENKRLKIKLNDTKDHIIEIYKFQDKIEMINEGCEEGEYIYQDWAYVKLPDDTETPRAGIYTYEVQLHDYPKLPASCIRVSFEDSRGQRHTTNITVQYMEVADYYGHNDDIDYTPDGFLQIKQRRPMYHKPETQKIPFLFPKYLTADNVGRKLVKTYVIYFTVKFHKRLVLHLEVIRKRGEDEGGVWWRSRDNLPNKPLPTKPQYRVTKNKEIGKRDEIIKTNYKRNKPSSRSHLKEINFKRNKPSTRKHSKVSNFINYMNESIVPRNKRQYFTNVAANNVFRMTNLLKFFICLLTIRNVIQYNNF